MLLNKYGFLFTLFFSSLLLVSSWAVSSPNARNISPEPTVKDYEQLVRRYRYYDPDSAIYYARKGMAVAIKANDEMGVATMWNQLGMIDDNLGEPQHARQKYLTAQSIYRKIGSRKGEAAVTIRLGVVELRKGNYDEAMKYFIKSLQISENDGNLSGVMEAYITIGEAYLGQKNYDKALQYLQKAEVLNKELPFSSLVLNNYNDFGLVYLEKGNYEEAISYFNKGLKLSNKPEYYGLYITFLNNLATVYAKQGLKEKSISMQKAALDKSREIKNYIKQIQTLIGLAGAYEKSSPAESLKYLKEALALAREKNTSRQELAILQKMSALYELLGDYPKAYRTKQQEHDLADSVFYRVMAKKVDNLQAEYELVQARSKVRELNFVNNEQKLEGKVTLGFTIVSLFLLIIVAYHYYRKKQLNGLFRKANAELEESNRIKDKLFSILAHDLRTPLASVITYLDHIDSDESVSVEERKLLISDLSSSCKATMGMLNNLLKWGEMQIKGVKLKPVVIKPAVAVEQTIKLLSEPARSKSLTVINMVSANVSIVADPDHFEFVLRNLLSNAIKFTPLGGKITISALADSVQKMVQFVVADNGIGISEERIKTIFKIENVSTKGTNEERGTSLGLLLCKDFIQANGGNIEVKSKLGEGSQFIFSLNRAVDEKIADRIEKIGAQ